MSARPERQAAGRIRRAREPIPRAVIQKVKLTESEQEKLRSLAAEMGVSVPRLLVESALAGRETPTDRRAAIAELFEIRRLLATIANNVNQLAHTANISGEVPAAVRLEGTLEEVEELVAGLRALTGVRR